jgi:hypothetical protein
MLYRAKKRSTLPRRMLCRIVLYKTFQTRGSVPPTWGDVPPARGDVPRIKYNDITLSGLYNHAVSGTICFLSVRSNTI